jgi:hypothetical protein
MTTHDADRQADIDPLADDDAPVEDEPETTSSRGQHVVDEDTDEANDAESQTVDTDETEQSAQLEPADEPDGTDGVADDRSAEPDPTQKLAPVGPDTALDPGTGSYEDRWAAIQAGFIDDPLRTVESAGALVTEIWDETVRSITHEREGVEARWQSTDSSTDDLRAAMQDYRALYARYARFTTD